MDYYGPRVPLGGGAIYGKHPTHVDRFGARVARELAIDAVKRGAGECMVRAVYAPNVAEPLDVQVEMIGGEGRVREEALVLCTPLHSKRKTSSGPILRRRSTSRDAAAPRSR
jgi:S-adenosylmethionine synthetase